MSVLSNTIQPCFAAFSLAVEPFEGGYDLRFGNLNTQGTKLVREVTIRITTDIGKQYRVYQRIEKPLTTPDQVEIDRNQFQMYTLLNSNSKGTLERIEEFPVMPQDTVVYTSNTAGDGDSFKLVYTLTPSVNQVTGSYYGRILYILIPIDSTQDQVVKTLNMYADLTNEGAVEISTDSGFKVIRISSKVLEIAKSQYPAVFISIKGNLGTRYRIYQQLKDSVLKGAGGGQFDLKKVTYTATEKNNSTITKQGDLFDLKSKTLIYTSDDLGSSNGISVQFKPAGDFSQQRANFYTGAIDYFLEMDRPAATLESGFIDSVALELEVEPVFRIIATSIVKDQPVTQEGVVQLRFDDLSYKSGAKESKVKIKIESNLGKPYLVTQRLSSPMQNEEGYKLADELFTFALEKKEDTEAKLKFDKETAVESEKDIPLFVSNTSGDNDEFEVTYRLRVTPDTRPGDFNTAISYSLSEL